MKSRWLLARKMKYSHPKPGHAHLMKPLTAFRVEWEHLKLKEHRSQQIWWLYFREYALPGAAPKPPENPKKSFCRPHAPQLQREKKELGTREKMSRRWEGNPAEKILKALSFAPKKIQNCPRWWTWETCGGAQNNLSVFRSQQWQNLTKTWFLIQSKQECSRIYK